MNRQEVIKRTNALVDDFDSLNLNVSTDAKDVLDAGGVTIFVEKFGALFRLLCTESFFDQLSKEIEDGKSLFAVQKKSKKFFDEILLPYIDSTIKLSRQWQFFDYRAINLQGKARDLSQEIREMYVEIYR